MSFELREYQDDARDTTKLRVSEGHRPIVCAATGAGKTVIAAHMANDAANEGKRVLWITPREEILQQAYQTFCAICGIERVGYLIRREPGFWMYPPITVASWHTLRARWKEPIWHIPADVLLVDEAHLSLSRRMVETVMPFYRERIVIGFTATPARKSGRGLGSYYTRIVQVRSVAQLQDDGYLARVEYWGGAHADVSRVKVDSKTRDYVEGELATAVMGGTLIGDVIENWTRLAPDRHTIVFAVNIAHAQALAERFQAAGVVASVLHSKMQHTTRQDVSDAFRKRETQVLVNVGIATYGYDVPSVNCVVVARPTKSIVLHHQMIGRGIRPKPDGDFCMVLDHGDNVRTLGLVEDEIRWSLDERREAATNTSRNGDPTRQKKPEAEPTICEKCGHIFARSRICPKCGWEKPVIARDIVAVDAELVRIARAQRGTLPTEDRMGWYQMMLGWAIGHGKKPGLAYYAYIDKFGEKPPKSWQKLEPAEPDPRVHGYMMRRRIAFARAHVVNE